MGTRILASVVLEWPQWNDTYMHLSSQASWVRTLCIWTRKNWGSSQKHMNGWELWLKAQVTNILLTWVSFNQDLIRWDSGKCFPHSFLNEVQVHVSNKQVVHCTVHMWGTDVVLFPTKTCNIPGRWVLFACWRAWAQPSDGLTPVGYVASQWVQ